MWSDVAAVIALAAVFIVPMWWVYRREQRVHGADHAHAPRQRGFGRRCGRILNAVGFAGIGAAFLGALEVVAALGLQVILDWKLWTVDGGMCPGGCAGVRIGAIMVGAGIVAALVAFPIAWMVDVSTDASDEE